MWRSVLAPTLVLSLLLALVSAGCSSLRGARLYRSGTESLDRGDPILAIRQLEEAATLVPEASEIQNHLGLAYTAAGSTARARSAFERAVALDCRNDAARANLEAMAPHPAAGDDAVPTAEATP